MATEPAHFTRTEDGGFMPTRFALSHWGDDHLNGPAIVGLSAQVLESRCGSPDFMPARLTVDLFRAARSVLTKVDVRVVRDGRRVRSAECDVLQDGRAVARITDGVAHGPPAACTAMRHGPCRGSAMICPWTNRPWPGWRTSTT